MGDPGPAEVVTVVVVVVVVALGPEGMGKPPKPGAVGKPPGPGAAGKPPEPVGVVVALEPGFAQGRGRSLGRAFSNGLVDDRPGRACGGGGCCCP